MPMYRVVRISVAGSLRQWLGMDSAHETFAYLEMNGEPIVQGEYRDAAGDWRARIFDVPSRTILAEIEAEYVEQAEEIFLAMQKEH